MSEQHLEQQANLHQAIKDNDLQLVRALLDAGADINAWNEDGDTPLFLAVKHRKVPIVEVLLAAKANINVIDKERRTALHFLACDGETNLVKDFLEAKADVTAQDNEGHTSLWWAARHNQSVATIQLLLDAKANAGEIAASTPLWDINRRFQYALAGPFSIIVKALITAKAEVNKNNFDLPLYLAAANPEKGEEYVTLLLKAKAKFSVRDLHGRTALKCAEEAGNTAAINVLQRKKTEQERLISILSGTHSRAGRGSVIRQRARSGLFEGRLLGVIHRLAGNDFPTSANFFRQPPAADAEQVVAPPSPRSRE